MKDRKTGKTIKDSTGQKRKGGIRRSYLKLVDKEYGGPIQTVVQSDRALLVSDLADDANADLLVSKVIQFQLEKLAAVPSKYKKYEKYALTAHKTTTLTRNPPMFVVPPYFLAESAGRGSWHATNVDLARRAKLIVADVPVFGVIHASLQALASDGSRFIKDYQKQRLDGFLLWVDGFSSDQDTGALQVVSRFIEALADLKKPIISMYGDAFALVLSYFGLTGYCSGIGYGEKKTHDQDPDVEGTIPPRYYIERLKKRIQIETEARRISLGSYPELICHCEICTRKPEPATLDDAESREHFMLVRASEITAIREGLRPADLASQLRQTYERYSADPVLSPLSHLKNWSSILSGK